MALWIETKAHYQKLSDSGKLKRVTDTYIVDALSMSEAEARITEELKPYVSGDFTVSATKQTKISEIFRDGKGDYWYMAVAAFITIDEKTGSEKFTRSYYLVQASDFRNAYENFLEGMKGTLVDFDIVSISETKIIDVFDAKLG